MHNSKEGEIPWECEMGAEEVREGPGRKHLQELTKVPLVLTWEGEAEGQPDTYVRSNMETLTQISQRCFKSAENRDVRSLMK